MHTDKYITFLFYGSSDYDQVFNRATAISDDDGNYIVVIQKHWNPILKATFWGPVVDGLLMDILEHENFDTVFQKESVSGKSKKPNIIELRKLMWKLGMKRPPKQPWE